MSQFKDLEEVVGTFEIVKIGNKDIKVYELSVLSVIELTKKISSIDKKKLSQGITASLIVNNIDLAIDLIAHCTASDREDVKSYIDNGKLKVKDLILIIEKMIEVNKEVFFSTIEKLKKVKESMDLLKQEKEQTGEK